MAKDKKIRNLYRSKTDKKIAGVCGGIAGYLNTDPTLIRLIWILGTLLWGAGLIGYILAWIIIPERK